LADKYSVYYVIDRTSFYKSAFDMYIRKECLTHNRTKNDRRSTSRQTRLLS